LFKSNKFFTWLAVLILLVFLYYIKAIKPFENLVYYLFLPIQSELYQKGNILSETWDAANLNNKELVFQNQILKNKVQELTINKNKLLELESENKILREQLNFFEDKNYQYLVARVIGTNSNYSVNSYTLNKGSNQGVKKGQSVIVGGGVIVGKIRQVFPQSSELLLLVDYQSVLAAIAQNQDNSPGIVEGQYGLSMKMNLIPQDKDISRDDIIITSGIEQYIPRGLVIGQVDKIETEVNELFQSALISSPVDYKKLNIVSIIVQ